MSRPTHHRRRRARPVLAAGLAAGLLALGGMTACTSDPAQAGDPTTTTTTQPTDEGPLDDQTPPRSTYGLTWHDNLVWVADFDGGQVVAVQPDTGEIYVRWEGRDGVTKGVNDLRAGDGGAMFWTGFDDGSVDRMSGGNFVPIAGLEPGVNAIALSADGRLFVARGDEGNTPGGDGLWEIDPRGEHPARLVAEEVGNVNAFDFGPDGLIYAPSQAAPGEQGSLVRIDPETGSVTTLVDGFDGPVAVKLSTDGGTAYVLSSYPPVLEAVDLATLERTTVAEPDVPFVNNLVVAPDGRIFISTVDAPELVVVAADGTTSTLRIGSDTTGTDAAGADR